MVCSSKKVELLNSKKQEQLMLATTWLATADVKKFFDVKVLKMFILRKENIVKLAIKCNTFMNRLQGTVEKKTKATVSKCGTF